MSNQNPTALFPSKLEPLFTPARYKSIRGGRGSGKSWGVARALLILGAQSPLRILCTREYQNSIAESVHKLLEDQIDSLGLNDFYEVQKTIITGRNGTSFTFAGLHHNINSIKSTEGLDIAWCEEAQTIPKASWDILIPTVRQPGSEIWLTWNPDLEEDDTYRRFVIEPDPRTVDIVVNWNQNPWFSDEMRAEKDHLKSIDYNAYLNVWGGECRQVVEGALWTQAMIASLRDAPPQNPAERDSLIASMRRIVVAVDPSGCSGKDDERSDEIGIVVAGLGRDGIGYVLEDRSGRYSPDGWGKEAISCFDRWKADRIVAEGNYGGAMVEHTIRTARQHAPVTLVSASRGKQVRAEPIAALYEQARVRHVGHFPEMERQLCLFSSSGYKGPRSPDRADACVAIGSLISTSRGEIPIELVLPGDYVLTRRGSRRVLGQRMTAEAASVIRISTASGHSVEATADHLFWTEENGFQRLDALVCGSTLLACQTSIRPAFGSKALSLGAIAILDAEITGSITPRFIRSLAKSFWGFASFMLRYGKRRTGYLKFRRVTTYIIGTITRSTTILTTWFALAHPTTERSMVTSRELQRSSLISPGFGTSQHRGIVVQKALLGTRNTPHGRGLIAPNITSVFANHVANRSARGARDQLDIARLHAIGAPQTRYGNMKSKFLARLAERPSGKTNTDQSPQFAPAVVVGFSDVSETKPVYDLMVEGEQEFFANGILVHNCVWALTNLMVDGPGTATVKPLRL